jgi:hypothetical protein
VHTDIKKCKIINWKDRSKNRAEWEKFFQEMMVCLGLMCHKRRIRLANDILQALTQLM